MGGQEGGKWVWRLENVLCVLFGVQGWKVGVPGGAAWGAGEGDASISPFVYPLFSQGQQGPGGVCPDAPIGGVSRGADPPPDDDGGLIAAGGAARGGPRRPRPPCTHALAASHPQPLPLDGGTLLRSVLALGNVGWVLNPSSGVLTDPPSCPHRHWAPCPAPEPAPCLPCLHAQRHAARVPPHPGAPCPARHPPHGAPHPRHTPHAG